MDTLHGATINISYMAHPGIHQTILNTDCAVNGRVLSFYIAPLVEVTDSSIPFKDFVRPWMIRKGYKWKRIACHINKELCKHEICTKSVENLDLSFGYWNE